MKSLLKQTPMLKTTINLILCKESKKQEFVQRNHFFLGTSISFENPGTYLFTHIHLAVDDNCTSSLYAVNAGIEIFTFFVTP